MLRFINNVIKIDSLTNSLIINKYDDRAELMYYGKKLHEKNTDFSCFSHCRKDKCFASNCDFTNLPSVMSSNGEGAQKSAFVGVVKDGIFINRFKYLGGEKVDGFSSDLPTARNKGETVCLFYKDIVSGVELKQYFTVFDDSGVIATHSEVINTTDSDITVNRLMSLQLDFCADRAEISSFDGHWDAERTRHDTILSAGRYENSSALGISSGEHNPFILVKINNGVMGFNLLWSGNHKEIVEVSPYGRVRVQTGMNDYQLNYTLAPGERLVSPEAIAVYGTDEATVTRELHKFSLRHIINPEFAYKDRPILINNWEGTSFNFTGDKIYDIAKTASECGIEMLVLDDGWFGKRNIDNCSLGDWVDNVEKTGGLKKLADRIKALGMKFGLWVEPEMICRDSDLFRTHPEYAQIIPGVEPIQRRHQLCIDLCNDEVVDHLANTLISLFHEVGVDYVKWDHNRAMSDVYSSKLENQGKYFYDYYVNLYKLLTRITEACPNVLFEACASGGCRYDLGMQYFMPQNWASDNTNAYPRLFIQEGTLIAYPQSSMGSHVSAKPSSSIESRFNVAAAGAFGYELDITKFTDQELDVVSAQVAYYKEHRHLLQFGNYMRLGDSLLKSDAGGWIVVSEDKSEAIAVLISKIDGKAFSRKNFTFAGLDENAFYSVKMRPQSNVEGTIEFSAYGDALINGSFDFGVLLDKETDAKKYSSRFASRMFYIKKIAD